MLRKDFCRNLQCVSTHRFLHPGFLHRWGCLSPANRRSCSNCNNYSFLASALSYHGNCSSGDSSADRRSWDNAAQWRAHIYCHYEAFPHRLHILGAEWKQRKRLIVLSNATDCYFHPIFTRSCENERTYHKACVKGSVHSFEDAAVWCPFCFTLVALASFVVLWSQEYTERVDLCLTISRWKSKTLSPVFFF